MTVNKRLAKSHGYYLQHAKEVCLVGRRGHPSSKVKQAVSTDTICSERRGQSQKPEEIYHVIEELVPNGKCYGEGSCKKGVGKQWPEDAWQFHEILT